MKIDINCLTDICRAQSDLTNIAAALLTAAPSSIQEDWGVRVPRAVLQRLECHDEKLKLLAVRVRKVARNLEATAKAATNTKGDNLIDDLEDVLSNQPGSEQEGLRKAATSVLTQIDLYRDDCAEPPAYVLRDWSAKLRVALTPERFGHEAERDGEG